MTIQVVALDWRWLFIYPEQQMASINEVWMPVDQAVKFEITSDAPMNSFWVPQLGGQIYAMPGMGTQLHLMADKAGTYYGSSANISGEGFADMRFKVMATNRKEFDNWVAVAQKANPLDQAAYNYVSSLGRAKDGINVYGKPMPNLYNSIINKYMSMDESTHMDMEGM